MLGLSAADLSLQIMVSCFVKTSRFEEYLRVKVKSHCHMVAAAVDVYSNGSLSLDFRRSSIRLVRVECSGWMHGRVCFGKFLPLKV